MNKPKPPIEHLELGLFGHARALVDVEEVAAKFVVSTQKVRDWEADTWLLGVPVGDGSQRQHVRINRASAEALYIFRMQKRGTVPPYRLSPETQWFLEEMIKREKTGSKLME